MCTPLTADWVRARMIKLTTDGLPDNSSRPDGVGSYAVMEDVGAMIVPC